MITVPLSRGLVALVDDADADLVLDGRSWHASEERLGGVFYAQRSVRLPDGRSTTVRMHNLIAGAPYVDHRNGDGLDNRRANLRPATHGENLRNARMRSDNSSGYRGVWWDARRDVWRTDLTVDGRRVRFGPFGDPITAARAYDDAARTHHGEFARLNFPEENR